MVKTLGFRIVLGMMAAGLAIAHASAAPISAEQAELARFALTRLAYGPAGNDVQNVAQMGTQNWIEQQLYPERIPLSPDYRQQMAQFDTLNASPQELFVRDRALTRQRKDNDGDESKKDINRQIEEPLRQARDAHLIAAIESPRQLQEVLVDFWYNHFNVYGHKEIDRIFVGQYENQAIRPYVLGHFRDMLEATAKSPAMLYYLDNWKNTAPSTKPPRLGPNGQPQAPKEEGINENYAREVMELHTLGVDGGYTQADVTQLARILSGWGFGGGNLRGNGPLGQVFGGQQAIRDDMDVKNHSAFFFNPDHHDFGDKVFLGRMFHGTGQQEGEQALDMLAYSPVTARHLSYELAQYFVADEPPESLVKRMTATWATTHGDLRAVMQTMLGSSEFWAPQYRAAKYRTPFQYVVAAVRASNAPIDTEALSGMLAKMGQEPYGCLTPDGYKSTMDAWLNPSATEARLTFATALGSGRLQQVHVVPGGGRKLKEPGMPDDGGQPLDAARIEAVLGNVVSPSTQSAINQAPVPLKAAMILGSPEMMRR